MGSLNRMSHEEYERLKKINAELKERQQQLRAEAEQRVKLAADLQKYNNALEVYEAVLGLTEDYRFFNIDDEDFNVFDMIMYQYLEVLATEVMAEHSKLLGRLAGDEQQSA